MYICICIIEHRSSGGAANRGPSGMLSPAAIPTRPNGEAANRGPSGLLSPAAIPTRPHGEAANRGPSGLLSPAAFRPTQTVRRPTGGQPGTTDLVPAPPLERTPTRSPPRHDNAGLISGN